MVAIAWSAPVAGAVSLEPTDWRSEVTSMEPATEVVTLDIIGGDALAALRVEPGHQVMIRGYENEPYLRVDPDGSVWENVRSPSCSLNRSTYGDGPLDESADAEAEPEWRQIGDGGVARWHDHRIHPMPGVTEDLDWAIALTIDGSSTTIHGRLARQASPSPVPWYAIAIAVAVGTVVLGRRDPLRWARLGAVVAAIAATVLTTADWATTPTGIDRPWLELIVTLTASIAAIGALLWRDRLAPRATIGAIGASLALTTGWVVTSLPVLSAAIVPGAFTAPISRSVVAIVGGLVLAAAGLLVLSGGIAALETDDQAVSR